METHSSSIDMLIWSSSSKSVFEVRSCYDIMGESSEVSFPWKVWSTKAPPRVSFFVWLAFLGKIMTSDNIRRRGMILVDRCTMCKADNETISHLFIHYIVATAVW